MAVDGMSIFFFFFNTYYCLAFTLEGVIKSVKKKKKVNTSTFRKIFLNNQLTLFPGGPEGPGSPVGPGEP